MAGCDVHGEHRPGLTVCDVHHIWPQGEGGPDVAANRVNVCPTGHRNIHEALNALKKGKTPPKVARKELALAQLGWDRIQRQAL
jgi:hypothetical protein